MTKSMTISALLSTLALLASAGAAAADPGVAVSGVNVRSGPGTNFAKVGSLAAGEHVEVTECQGSWCYVDRASGKDGWVAANYLKPAAIKDDADDADLPFNMGVTIGPNGPSISFGIGNQPAQPQPQPQPQPTQPQPPQNGDKACFYTGFHFNGQSACVNIGASSTFLIPGWDNEIESFKIVGTGKVELCRDANFGGGCVVYSSSQSSLPASYANAVSSYQTYP